MFNVVGSGESTEQFEQGWRCNGTLLLVILLVLLGINTVLVLIYHVAGLFLGYATFSILNTVASAFMATAYPGEVLGGGSFFTVPILTGYIGFATLVEVGLGFWMKKRGVEAISTEPKEYAVGLIFLTVVLVIPLLSGLIIGFW